jgi:hypothetical protein
VKRIQTLIFALTVFGAMAQGALIPVGDIFYVDNGNGTTQFYIDNFTGLADGCSTPNGFPVCTELTLVSGSLTYSYDNGAGVVNGSALLLAPLGPNALNFGASHAPVEFLLPSTNILTAFFNAMFAPAGFTTDLETLVSNGAISSGDIVAASGFALLSADGTTPSAIPEPSSLALALLGGAMLVSKQFRR